VNDIDPTIAVVVVQWFIKPGREEEFLRDREPIRQADGFLGEVLFRTIVDTDDPAEKPPVVFLNILYWRSREDFYRKRRHLNRGAVPDMNDYEASPRRRHWLVPVA
jgi:heme-degrading monooxygenase HmoA